MDDDEDDDKLMMGFLNGSEIHYVNDGPSANGPPVHLMFNDRFSKWISDPFRKQKARRLDRAFNIWMG